MSTIYYFGYEWDADKASRNIEKHGVSFEEAAQLMMGDYVEYKANVKGESRSKAVTRFNGEYFAIVFTRRGKRIRIISARHATAKERAGYEKHINGGV